MKHNSNNNTSNEQNPRAKEKKIEEQGRTNQTETKTHQAMFRCCALESRLSPFPFTHTNKNTLLPAEMPLKKQKKTTTNNAMRAGTHVRLPVRPIVRPNRVYCPLKRCLITLRLIFGWQKKIMSARTLHRSHGLPHIRLLTRFSCLFDLSSLSRYSFNSRVGETLVPNR